MHVFVRKTGEAGSRTVAHTLVNVGIHVPGVLALDKMTAKPVLETRDG